MTVPKFDVVYAGKDLIKTLFELRGYKTRIHTRWNHLSATRLRDSILGDKDWEGLVPKTTLKYLKKFGFVNRLKEIAKHD